MKRIGPELKIPDLKVPPFFSDLYWDLRDRHLLPIVGLVIVAIVAVPFMLKDDTEEVPPPPPTSGIEVTPESVTADASSLTVVQAKPGLRDYRKRLRRREPTDPFKQRFTGPNLRGAKLNEQTTTTTTTSSSTSSSSTTISSSGSGSSPSPAPSPSVPPAGPSGESELRIFTFAMDVKVKTVPGDPDARKKDKGETVVKEGVKPGTPLPGEKAPVITYLGVVDNANTALIMVSNDVTSVFGDTKCLSGTETCELVGVQKGFPVTFVYGFAHNRLKITVLDIKPVITGKLKGTQPQFRSQSFSK